METLPASTADFRSALRPELFEVSAPGPRRPCRPRQPPLRAILHIDPCLVSHGILPPWRCGQDCGQRLVLRRKVSYDSASPFGLGRPPGRTGASPAGADGHAGMRRAPAAAAAGRGPKRRPGCHGGLTRLPAEAGSPGDRLRHQLGLGHGDPDPDRHEQGRQGDQDRDPPRCHRDHPGREDRIREPGPGGQAHRPHPRPARGARRPWQARSPTPRRVGEPARSCSASASSSAERASAR